MQTLQQKMKAKLESVGLRYRNIDVYGSQIVITCASHKDAYQWRGILNKFSTVRAITESRDLTPEPIRVWRIAATI